MCGITGAYTPGGLDSQQLESMGKSLTHRGPDGFGAWVERDLGLAHRRLSILDLSPAGAQPMESPSGRYVVVFNGEIYNHLELRAELAHQSQVTWRGTSDTETLLMGCEVWGLQTTIQKSVGMFALGLWDRQEKRLWLTRDRAGEKPLYYGWAGETFLFGSELKALRVWRTFQPEIDIQSVSCFLATSYIPQPSTIYTGIRKLTPGTLREINLLTKQETEVVYWSGSNRFLEGCTNPLSGSVQELQDQCTQVLSQAVQGQLISDVPLGAFLSGGIDSSLIVALMQRSSTRPVQTFTIGYENQGFNEAVYAKQVADYLGTNHTELYVTPQDALDTLESLPTIFDEPFGDSSQIPTLLLSRLTRNQVTVALSGDGGDELFGGYTRYLYTQKWYKTLVSTPQSLKPFGKKLLDLTAGLVGTRNLRKADQLHKMARALSVRNAADLYQSLVSPVDQVAHLVKDTSLMDSQIVRAFTDYPNLTPVEQMMLTDFLYYLPDDVLVKVDRSAMNYSLETRAPFLDHRVIEFAFRLPMEYKLRNNQGKWLVKQVLYSLVPEQLFNRPKAGFAAPIAHWLRFELAQWIRDLVLDHRFLQDRYYNQSVALQLVQEHQQGTKDHSFLLWNLGMFLSWYRANYG